MINFKTQFKLYSLSANKRNEITTWCQESFGKKLPTGYAKWDHYANSGISSESKLIIIDYFIFYDDLAAFAFKLQWL